MSSPAAPDAAVTEEERAWWHEAMTMALYVSLSLLAVLVALPPGATLSESHLAMTVLLTAVSLLLAHQVAFRLSTRLMNRGLLDAAGARLLAAQAAGGLAVAIGAALPVFVFGPDGIGLSELMLLAFVTTTGYRAARMRPASRLRALGYVALVAGAVLLVLLVKSLAGH